jgi:SAM-dependent MidA family methyltransferase
MPDEVALQHSAHLSAIILQTIRDQQKPISFADYMQLALYYPGYGYYTAGSQKLGASGDFITAPELSPLFSKCLARSCHSILEPLGQEGSILEIGAGSGQMAVDILRELATLNALPSRYFILEVSAELRKRQQIKIKQQCPQWLSKVVWLDTLPAHGFQGVILANEICDAMPAHRFCITQEAWYEGRVAEQEGRFIWQWGPAKPTLIDTLNTRFKTLAGFDQSPLPYIDQLLETVQTPYYSEINLNIKPWIKSLGALLHTGAMIVIDYGFPRQEYYHPMRDRGTLRCHYRHYAHNDPFFYPGLQDITTHVDFTDIAEAALDSGLQIAGFTNQSSFLIAAGLLEIAQKTQVNEPAFFKQNRDIQLLTSPNSMGELFKVMALSKNVHTPILGFSLNDMRYRL